MEQFIGPLTLIGNYMKLRNYMQTLRRPDYYLFIALKCTTKSLEYDFDVISNWIFKMNVLYFYYKSAY